MVVHVEAPRAFRHLVNELLETSVHQAYHGMPAIEVTEDDQQTQVVAELPGVKKEDLKVGFEDGVLTLRGIRQQQELPDSARVILNERHVRDFKRRVRPAHEVESQHISAQLTDGVLTVTLPKAEKAKARTITVR
jgi:HSP20 family protein